MVYDIFMLYVVTGIKLIEVTSDNISLILYETF